MSPVSMSSSVRCLAGANGVSAGSSLARLRYRCCKVQSFSRGEFSAVDGTAYMHIGCNRNWSPYSRMYKLQNDIEFETITTSNTEHGNFEHNDYPSIYIAVLLAVHVFDCDVAEDPCEGAVCECDNYSKFTFYCANEQKYRVLRLWNWKQRPRTWFSQFISYFISDYRFIKQWSIWIHVTHFKK